MGRRWKIRQDEDMEATKGEETSGEKELWEIDILCRGRAGVFCQKQISKLCFSLFDCSTYTKLLVVSFL
jgi:hypothetical protein